MREHRLRRVDEAFDSLPHRYLGASEDFSATIQVRLGDVGRTWEVQLDGFSCRVRRSASRRPDVVIGTDAPTWLALREGRLSGLDAFADRRLWARGNIDVAVGFEGLFDLPGGRPPLLRMHDVHVRNGARVSTLTAGSGEEHVLLIHGLGGSKSSFFPTVSALAPRYRVHAVDLPGFGASSKPARAAYDSPFFARSMLSLMDSLAIDRAHVVGNSMGGRVALEVALRAPRRVRSLSLLAPSLAWRRGREWAPVVKLLRPELAAIPHVLTEGQVRGRFWDMIGRPERVDPAIGDIAADEFLRNYRSRTARVAFYAAARNIYLEKPFGRSGFWTRLPELAVPSLFIWGSRDPLVPPRFSRHVAGAVPHARQVVLYDCGHVPQIELPDRTHDLISKRIADAAGSAAALAARAC